MTEGTDSTVTFRIAADVTSFCVAGIFGTVQQLVRGALGEATDNLELIAEESLVLTTVTTSRVAGFALKEEVELQGPVTETLLALPFRYMDYTIGLEMLSGSAKLPESTADFARLERKLRFYGAHFAPAVYPASRVLTEKMQLWMGRISDPGREEHPNDRLERIAAVDMLSRHLRLVLEFIRQELQDRTPEK